MFCITAMTTVKRVAVCFSCNENQLQQYSRVGAERRGNTTWLMTLFSLLIIYTLRIIAGHLVEPEFNINY